MPTTKKKLVLMADATRWTPRPNGRAKLRLNAGERGGMIALHVSQHRAEAMLGHRFRVTIEAAPRRVAR